MKRFLLMTMMVFTACLSVKAQWGHNRLTVVVYNDGSLAGRFVRETDSTYIANPLDWEVEVSKTEGRKEVWSPEKGKGFVVRADGVRGNINVRKGPSTRTAIVSTITEADGKKDYPDCAFDCLGKVDNWYKIKIKGKVGYVREDLVEWAAYYAD